MEFSTLELLVSFAGGIFGAAIGAFPVWIICGLAVLIGAVLNCANGDPSFMTYVAWGWFLGPQTSFTGGTAAAAYAAKKGLLESGRDISTSLLGLKEPKVLLVGGIFGAIGYLICYVLMNVPNYSDYAWTNTIALAVILNMVIVRFMFGSTGLFGRKREEGECCWIPTQNAAWVDYQSTPAQLVMLAIAVGTPASYLAIMMPNSSGIIFGFVTVLLIFMLMGFKVPVTHHIALSASMVTSVTGSFEWGLCFGFLAAYLGEICACMLLYRGDTHIDPPTTALVLTFTIFPIVELAGMFSLPAVPSYAIMIAVVVAGYVLLSKCKRCSLSNFK